MKENADGTYQRVSCAFYSQLELLSLRKQEVVIRYIEDGVTHEGVCTIRTLKSRKGEEFLLLNDGKEIRLDMIKAIHKFNS